MMRPQTILEQLKNQGARMTKARILLVKMFQKNHLPLTELEIRAKLSQAGKAVNKTTVYRELEYLKSKSVIKEADFSDGKKRYEFNSSDHHHHLICTNCKKVDDIRVEDDVSHIEKKISRNKDFKIINHSLEFFGLCKNCR